MLTTRRLLIAIVASLLIAGGLASQASASPGAYKVLFVYADSTPTTIENQLRAEPGIAAVDNFDANSASPTAATLAPYDLVVAFSEGTYDDAAAVGNALADYVDQGGAVVEYAYDTEGDAGQIPTGRWATGNYAAVSSTPANNHNTPGRALGTYDASSPLMQGVSALAANDNTTNTVAPGGTLVAQWNDDGAPLVAYKGRVVAVTAYIGASAASWSGDFARLTLNAVQFLGRHTLSVAKAGTGAGTVTSSPGGINCGTACSADYAYVTQVTLTATAAPGSAFSGWGGACAGAGSAATCTLNVDAAKSATASFAALPPILPVLSGKATFHLLSRLVSINLKTGKGVTRLACDNVATDECVVNLVLRAAQPSRSAHGGRAKRLVKVGVAKGTVAGGKRGRLTVKLSRRGIKLLKSSRHRKLKVQARGSSKNRANQASAIAQTLTLKGKPAKRRH